MASGIAFQLTATLVGEVAVAATVITVVMAKFELEMSKNGCDVHSTRRRAADVVMFGTVIACAPSFGVLARIVVGNVRPLSVERRIFTLAQLTGGLFVPATFHVTVCVELPVQLTNVFGDVTVNGPEVVVTFTVVAA